MRDRMKFYLQAFIFVILANGFVLADSGAEWKQFSPAADIRNWKVYNGSEFPGTKGKLSEEKNGGLLLSGKFEGRSVYVAAALKLRISDPKTRIKVTAVTDCRIALRCQDQKGHFWQTATTPLKANETYTLLLSPDQHWPICWGGVEKGKQPIFPYRSIQINAMRIPKASELKLCIDEVQIPQAPVSLEPIFLPVQVLNNSKQPSPKLVLRNNSTQELRLSGEIQVMAYDESRQTLKVSQDLPRGGKREIELPIPENVQGSWRVFWKLEDCKAGIVFRGEDRFSRMIPAGVRKVHSRPEFLFGIAAHPEHYSLGERVKMAEAAALCGAHLIRTDARWTYHIQPKPNLWDYRILDSVVDIFSGKGLGIQLILAGCPNWAVAKNWIPKKSAVKQPTRGRRPDYDAWRKFVRKTVHRYADRISLYEVWNEPDIISFANFSTEDYMRLLEIAFQEIKAISPNLKVISGGLSGYQPGREDLFQQIAKSSSCDIFAFHGHGFPENYLQQIKELKRILTIYPKPWYSNETAISSLSCGEYQQAIVLFQKLFAAWENGSIGYTWYNLREKGGNPKDSEHHYGMITYDFKAKPVYLTFNMLTTLFRGAQFEGRFPLSSEVTSYCFRAANGDWLYPFWQAGAVSEALYGVGGISQNNAEVIDLVGNRHPVPVTAGMAVIRSSTEPQVLRIPAQSGRPIPWGKLFSGPAVLSVSPEGESTWDFSIRNPSKKALHWNFAAELPESVSVFSWPSEIKISPGEEKTFRVRTRTASGFADRKAVILKIGDETLHFPLQSRIQIPWKKFPETAQFQLRHAEQVVPLVEHEPRNAHLFWYGPGDLSAEVRLARDSDKLKLRIDVTDDRHVVKDFNESAWKSDSVQFAIALNSQKTPWKIGLSHINAGKSAVFIWSAPDGFNAKNTAEKIHLRSSRNEKTKQTVYEAEIPFPAIGLNPQKADSFRFNLLVNDNDGEIRESYIAIAPDLGNRLNAENYPTVHLK